MGSGNLRLLLHLRKAKANRSSIFCSVQNRRMLLLKIFSKNGNFIKTGTYIQDRTQRKGGIGSQVF